MSAQAAAEFHWRARAPWRLLLATALAHGLLIPWLGFYWDDWTPVLVSLMPGSTWREFLDAFWQNRPVSGLLFWALMGLLGPRPWAWHGLLLLLRWLTAWQTGALVARVWPRHKELAWWTGLLLALYPAFRLQPIAVAFTPHWLSLLLAVASLAATWHGWHAATPRGRWAWWAASWVAMLAALLLVEYSLGLEPARWALLAWLAWRARTTGEGPHGRRGLAAYALPYLLALGLGFYALRAWSRPPELAAAWQAWRRYPGGPLYSWLYLLAFGWFPPDLTDMASWRQIEPLKWLAVSGVLGGGLALAVWFLRPRYRAAAKYPRAALEAGLALSLAALLPFWVNGRFAGPLYADRFVLPGMVAAALFWAAVLAAARCAPPLQRVLALALLTLAGQTLFYNSLTYVKIWRQARSVWAQVYWRVPAVKPQTLFIGDTGAVVLTIAEYVAGESYNALYRDAQTAPRTLAYWYTDAARLPAPPAQAEPFPITHEHKIWTFQGRLQHSLVFNLRQARTGLRCVWLVAPEDADNPYLPDALRPYARFSAVARIQPRQPVTPPAFFGIPPRAETWCYFFQKAELARQMADWPQVVRLWEQAQAAGLRPRHIYEYRPFILGLGHTGQWDAAAALSRRAWEERPANGDDEAVPYLCQTWRTLLAQTPASPAREAAWAQVQAMLPEPCP